MNQPETLGDLQRPGAEWLGMMAGPVHNSFSPEYFPLFPPPVFPVARALIAGCDHLGPGSLNGCQIFRRKTKNKKKTYLSTTNMLQLECLHSTPTSGLLVK